MKETGIIMSGNHPRLILDGLKTQTRRVIKHPERYEGIRDCDFCCPYGQIGSRLLVRETWATEKHIDKFSPSSIGNAGCVPVFYKADEPNQSLLSIGKWRPSIFMPRWASRITLEITEVRVERLAEILWTDIIHEGFNPQGKSPNELKHEFVVLWDSLNAKRGYGWEANPWIFVISFKRVDK